jgi:hypothetical protein
LNNYALFFIEAEYRASWRIKEGGDPQAVVNTAWACVCYDGSAFAPKLFAEIKKTYRLLVGQGGQSTP